MFKPLNFAGGSVAGKNDLFMRLMQGIECVKKFLLNSLFACQKLDVVNQQHVRLTIFFTKLGELIVLYAVNVFVGEFLGRNVSDPRTLFVGADVLANGMKQM